MRSGKRPLRSSPPGSHYFVSLSRGDSIRTLVLAPALFWTLAALAPVSLGAGAAGAGYLAMRGAAATAREADARRGAEEALAQERVRSDGLADHAAFEVTLRDLLTREARLERDGAVVAALAKGAGRAMAQTGTSGGALQAIEALTTPSAARPTPAPAVRAYAPAAELTVQPQSLPSGTVTPSATPAAPRPADLSAAENPALDLTTRLDLARMALDRLEGGQMISLAAIDRAAQQASAGKAAILLEAGLDPDRLAPPPSVRPPGAPLPGAGPDAPPFAKAAARVAEDVAAAGRLTEILPSVPLREPLLGDSVVSSPFGYRSDPFLGRPMLHPGIDLIEGYGSTIHATASGTVAHSGPMGGYGMMVEIDHGNGLRTRYGHMSETFVAEGEAIAAGDSLGRVGSTGRSTGPHLHYEVRIDGEPVDPERFLKAGARLAAFE